ncbi:hypothetical protein OSTOST_13348 [Ostertagia ostertagi]
MSFRGWIVLFCALHVTHSSSLIDRICKINRSFNGCASRTKERNNETRPKWIRADELSDEDQKFLRLARQTGDDPSCKTLKPDAISAALSHRHWAPQAFEETKISRFSELKIDFSAYCKKSRERFQYVCPKPFRFKTYAEQAVDFCIRYKERCPGTSLPDEPVPFKKEDESHIYIREIQSACKNMYRGARTYCFHPELLKYPKYAIPCALYKMTCVDVYNKVIYG